MIRTTLLALTLAACGGAPAPTSGTAAKAAVDPACLAKADLADGTEDKVIHNCPNCGLGMAGDPVHASTVDGYTAHSCNADCKHALDADPGAVFARACAK